MQWNAPSYFPHIQPSLHQLELTKSKSTDWGVYIHDGASDLQTTAGWAVGVVHQGYLSNYSIKYYLVTYSVRSICILLDPQSISPKKGLGKNFQTFPSMSSPTVLELIRRGSLMGEVWSYLCMQWQTWLEILDIQIYKGTTPRIISWSLSFNEHTNTKIISFVYDDTLDTSLHHSNLHQTLICEMC